MKYLILCITLFLSTNTNAFAFGDTRTAIDAGVEGSNEDETLYCRFGDVSYSWIVGNNGVTTIRHHENNSGQRYIVEFENGSETLVTYAHCMHHTTNKGGF